MSSFGFPQSQWDAAKHEVLEILQKKARRKQTIAYSDLAAQIASIRFEANDHLFHELLGQLSEDEDAAGRGMISVLVVCKSDPMPGPGFFKLAARLGRTEHDRNALWINEFKKVVEANAS